MCDSKDISKIIKAWLAGTHHGNIYKSDKNVNTELIKEIYNICGCSVKKYIQTHLDKWKIGGDNIVVVVDKYSNVSSDFYSNEVDADCGNIILGLAEIKEIPPKYYFKIIPTTTTQSSEAAMADAIKTIVHPGTIIVVDDALSTHDLLNSLKETYQIVITTSMLEVHNTASVNIIDNLNVIWASVIRKCFTDDIFDIENTLLSLMWTQVFGNSAFDLLMNELCFL